MISFIEEIKDDPRFIDRGGFSMHDELHQKFWVVEDKLKPEIRDRLIEIVKDFMDGVGEDI